MSQELLVTPLHALHIEMGAKMVPFAGYDMPVQYALGVRKEHIHCRESAGLFDVSHMGQLRLHGANAAKAIEALVPVDIIDLPEGKQRYAFFTNEQGGILDDLMVTNRSGIIIRLPLSDLRVMGRATQGVKVMRIDENDTIADVTVIRRDGDEDEEE